MIENNFFCPPHNDLCQAPFPKRRAQIPRSKVSKKNRRPNPFCVPSGMHWRIPGRIVFTSLAIFSSANAQTPALSFRYVAIPPVDLSPGQRYVIGAAYSGAGDWVVSSANNPAFAIATPPTIVFGNRRSVYGGPALVFPDFVDTEFTGDFGPNFLFTDVPEPSSISLALLATVVIVAGQTFPQRARPSR
jgi:hypothetical protein